MENTNQDTLLDITKQVVLNAPIQKVWEAVATSEGIAAWFMPNNFQPQVGYEFHLDAGPFGHSPCKVTELDPPHRLAFTWGKDWTLTIELAEQEGKTALTLIHSGWDENKVTEFGQTHREVRERMNQGWTGIAQALARYVEA